MGTDLCNPYYGDRAHFLKSIKNKELFEIGKKKTKMATEKLAKFTERETRMTLKHRKRGSI